MEKYRLRLGNSIAFCSGTFYEDLQKAKEIQKLAENYLFDSKVLLCISLDYEIEHAAKAGIDGVIFWKI